MTTQAKPILAPGWQPCQWPYGIAEGQCYMRSIKRGKVYLRDTIYYPYTVSCGHDSDRSHSGCFFGHSHVNSLVAAMNEIDLKNFE